MKKKGLIKKDAKIFPLAKYNLEKFSKNKSVSFTGSAIQHPYDNEKFILISDPLSKQTQFLEFSKSDVVSVEELSSILSENGESIQITKVWIQEGVVALRYQPFIVGKNK